jgi:hypothetical protein
VTVTNDATGVPFKQNTNEAGLYCNATPRRMNESISEGL